MKKVGIVTFYRNYNYGSVLQAFALSNVIQDLAYDAVMINYYNKTAVNIILKIQTYKNKLFSCIQRPFLIKKLFRDRIISRRTIREQSNEVKRKYDTFINEHFQEYNDNYKKYASRDFLAFVCGSDQIWSLDAVGLSELYYLRFAPESMRIAYAPSFGCVNVPNYNLRRLKRYLKQIPSLSVREVTGIDIIRQCTGREVNCVLDPVLLIGKAFWERSVEIREKKEYVVCYFLGDASESYSVIDKLQKSLHTDVLWIRSGRKMEDKQYRQIGPNPLEYVSLIKNAKFVCTDSFHATAFSVMLQTPFFVFERKYETAKEQGTRIDSFLSIVSLQNRKISNNKENLDTAMDIDFSYAQRALETVREDSIRYLTDALEIAKNANCRPFRNL